MNQKQWREIWRAFDEWARDDYQDAYDLRQRDVTEQIEKIVNEKLSSLLSSDKELK